MDHAQTCGELGLGAGGDRDPHVADVMQRAKEELRQLIAERAEITKRIGNLKRTIVALGKLFGTSNADPLDTVNRKRGSRLSGITSTCRRVLMESMRPMNAREVCDEVQRVVPDFLARNKDPMSAINTILTRLVNYGEATTLHGDLGQRVWLWAQRDSGSRHVPDENGSDAAR